MVKVFITYRIQTISKETHEFEQMGQRLESAISFTITRFLYDTLSKNLDDYMIVIICVLLLVLSTIMRQITINNDTVSLVRKMSVLLISQTLISLTVNSDTLNSNNLYGVKLLVGFVDTTGLLVLAAIIPTYLSDIDYVQRSIVLLLYMYADASEALLYHFNINVVVLMVVVLVYSLLQIYKNKVNEYVNFLYVVRALKMVCINIILNSVKILHEDADNFLLQTIVFFIIVLFIDCLKRTFPTFTETRDYAIWKSGRLLSDIVIEQQDNFELSLAFALLFVFIHKQFNYDLSLFELSSLIFINITLWKLSEYINTLENQDQILMLIIYILLISKINKFLAV